MPDLLSRHDYHAFWVCVPCHINNPIVKHLEEFHYVLGTLLVYTCGVSSNHI